jgi:hypothetical protein
MNILISAEPHDPHAGWTLRTSCESRRELAGKRSLGRDAKGNPLPPAEESDSWQGPYRGLCDGTEPVADAVRKSLSGEDAEAVVKVGGYLGAVLLGPSWAAAFHDEPFIDLELDFRSAPELHALPWEMMFWGGDPVVGLPRCVVSVKRRVAAEGTHAGSEGLARPIRVLFVVGRQLDDYLRPGAEILGVLRQLAYTLQRGGTESRGSGLHARLLVEATGDDLEAALREFKPHVAHFICHGTGGGDSTRLVFTVRNGPTASEDPWDSARLLDRFRGAGCTPSVVMLNACKTASARPGVGQLSFAARLAAGVPVVVGMAGEVEDAACQMFARRLYRCLIDRTPIHRAVAEARRAAILHFGHYRDSGEWARPTLFQSAELEFGPDDTAAETVVIAADRFRDRADGSILCDRLGGLRWYQNLRDRTAAGRDCRILAIADPVGTGAKNDPQVGKTWLLKEFAALAALDLFVPCLLAFDEGSTVPPSLLGFALLLAEAMEKTREQYGLTRRRTSDALRLAWKTFGIAVPDENAAGYPVALQDATDEALDRACGRNSSTEADAMALPVVRVAERIRSDIKRLLDDVRAVVPGARAAVVMIDNFQRCAGVAGPLIGRNGAFQTPYGLGDAGAPASVVLTFLARDRVGEDVKAVLKEQSRNVQNVLLDKFDGPELWLAYRQSLRLWDPPLAVTTLRDRRSMVEEFFENVHEVVGGWPSRLVADGLRPLIKFAKGKAVGVVLPANDEAILAAQLAEDQRLRAAGGGS